MKEGFFVCAEDDVIETAAKLMARNKVRHLLVMDRSKSLAGIVSLEDLVPNLETREAGEFRGYC